MTVKGKSTIHSRSSSGLPAMASPKARQAGLRKERFKMSMNQKYTWHDFLREHPEHREKKTKRTSSEGKKAYTFPKTFHVSPFMGMDQTYVWRFTTPGHSLSVHMENWESGQRMFDATMVMRRREISRAALTGVLLRYPLMTAKVIGAIHWNALKLWVKRCPFYPHPKWLSEASRDE